MHRFKRLNKDTPDARPVFNDRCCNCGVHQSKALRYKCNVREENKDGLS